jgi:hypothetical protein
MSRAGFQTCPQRWHLQYVASLTTLLVVVTLPERQNGQGGAAATDGATSGFDIQLSSGVGALVTAPVPEYTAGRRADVHYGTAGRPAPCYAARMRWFAQPAPRLYIDCPRCGSATALVSHERHDSQTCFCPGCRHLWQSGLTRPAPPSGASSRPDVLE